MRRILLASVAFFPSLALADTIQATSQITEVTVFADVAEVTREITFTASTGQHDLQISDMPISTELDALRIITPGAGLAVGAHTLRRDRLPPQDDALSPEQQAAKDAVEAIEASQRNLQTEIDGINGRMSSAAAQIAFLNALATGDRPLGDGSAEALRSVALMIGEQSLAASQSSLAAQTDLIAAQQRMKDLNKDLVKAQETQVAITPPDIGHVTLTVTVDQAAEGTTTLQVKQLVQANWRPTYDASLTRGDEPSMKLVRGVLVSQNSGEDWQGVNLSLSTAQLFARSQPSDLYPQQRGLWSQSLSRSKMSAPEESLDSYAAGAMEPAPVAQALAASAEPNQKGEPVTYTYPVAVDVATGVEDLNIALDELIFSPTVTARAVPVQDTSAYMMAEFTNTTGEILLPGQVRLYREGTMVGTGYLGAVQPNEESELAFGPIQGLILTREMPNKTKGDRGFISVSNQLEETATLTVKNLTDEDWPVRVLDQIPYSEEEELEITYSADPSPTETDLDGQRGILAWDFDLAAGAEQKIKLTHVMQWPDGKEVQ